MRLSRHCYDKAHRCPGWAGGGLKYPKGANRCDNGHIQIDYSNRWKRDWTFHRCDKCDVVCWPIVTQWLDPAHWRWWVSHRIKSRLQDWVWHTLQPFIVATLARLCGWIDRIPAYRRRPGPGKGRHWTQSQWGCWPLRLAHRSMKLDERWKTCVWEDVPDGEEEASDHVIP